MAEATKTVDLGEIQEGASAEVKQVMPWRLAKQIALKQADNSGLDVVDVLLGGLVVEWNVRGEDGDLLPLPGEPGVLDKVDTRIVMALSEATREVMAVMMGKASALGTTDSSPDGSEETKTSSGQDQA